jgi:hypothetical protein
MYIQLPLLDWLASYGERPFIQIPERSVAGGNEQDFREATEPVVALTLKEQAVEQQEMHFAVNVDLSNALHRLVR